MSKDNKFIKGAAILGIAGLVVKALGAVFRIPLTNWIGADGMSYYGFAYTIYSVLIVLATAGIPVAISRMVSERIAMGEHKNAHKVFKTASTLMAGLGVISFAICYLGAEPITAKLGNPDAAMAVKAIAPALLFVPILSSFRGYFQGRQNMNPTAISEITEQFVRVIVGLTAAFMLAKVGFKEAAAGASFGASAGALGGLIIMTLIYMLNRHVIHEKNRLHSQETESTATILKKIIMIAVPIIIGSEMMPVMGLIDTSLIMTRLQATGWTFAEAKELYGQFSGFCNSLISFPQIFTQAVAVSLVPAIAASFRIEDKKKVKENVQLGYRMTMIMAFPCAFGLFALAKPILLLLYSAQRESAIAAAPTLMIMSIGVIFLAISQTSVGVLQAIGLQHLPVRHLFIGCIFKIFATFFLVSIPAINVKGAAIGTMIAYITDLTLNNMSIRRATGVKFDYMLTYVKPAVAAAVMGLVAFGVHSFTAGFLGNSIATLLAIAVGGLTYAVLIFVVKAITIDEVEMLPGGTKLNKIIRKIMK